MIKKYVILLALIFCTSPVSSMPGQYPWRYLPIDAFQYDCSRKAIEQLDEEIKGFFYILETQELSSESRAILWEHIVKKHNNSELIQNQLVQCHEYYKACYLAAHPENAYQFLADTTIPCQYQQATTSHLNQAQIITVNSNNTYPLNNTYQLDKTYPPAQTRFNADVKRNAQAKTNAKLAQEKAEKKVAEKIAEERKKAEQADAQAKAERNAERNANKKKKLAQEKAEKKAEQTRLNNAATTIQSLARKNAAQKIVYELRKKKAQAYAQAKIREDAKRDKVLTKKMTAQTQAIIEKVLLTVDAQEKNTAQKTKKKTKKANKATISVATNTKQDEIEETISHHQKEHNDYIAWRTDREAQIKRFRSWFAKNYDQANRGKKFNKDERSQTIEKLVQHEINQIDKDINTFFDEYEAILNTNNIKNNTIAYLKAMYANLKADGEVPHWRLAYDSDQEARILNRIKTMSCQSIEAKNMISEFHCTHFNTTLLQDPQSCNLRTKGIVSSEALHTSEQEITNLLQLNTESSSDSIASIISNLLEQANIRPDTRYIKSIIDKAPVTIHAIKSNKLSDSTLYDMLYAQYAMPNKLLLIPEPEDQTADKIKIHICLINGYSKALKK